MNFTLHNGDIGWIGLAAYVLLWDLFAPETLTDSIRRALFSKYRRIPTGSLIGVTVLHLLGILPEVIDPYHHLSRLRRTHLA